MALDPLWGIPGIQDLFASSWGPLGAITNACGDAQNLAGAWIERQPGSAARAPLWQR